MTATFNQSNAIGPNMASIFGFSADNPSPGQIFSFPTSSNLSTPDSSGSGATQGLTGGQMFGAFAGAGLDIVSGLQKNAFARAKHAQSEFMRRFNNTQQNIQIRQANARQLVQNERFARDAFNAITKDLITNERGAQEQIRQFTNQQANLQGALLATASKRNITGTSGSVRALARANATKALVSFNIVRENARNASDTLKAKYKAQLNQRNQVFQEQQAFIPAPFIGPSKGAIIGQGLLKLGIGLASGGMGG